MWDVLEHFQFLKIYLLHSNNNSFLGIHTGLYYVINSILRLLYFYLVLIKSIKSIFNDDKA